MSSSVRRHHQCRPTPGDLLALQDAGEPLSPPRRALLLAAYAPGPPPTAAEPVGRTHARLLRLHEHLAGPTLVGTVVCGSCGATVELSADCEELLTAQPDAPAEPEPLVADDGARPEGAGLSWRPVSYEDLAVAAEVEEEAHAVTVVLSRCVEGEVTDALRPSLTRAMAAADPLAEIEVELLCPECAQPVRALLDVLDFAWAQVVAQAQALLLEVDVLARAYSWSEAEILALPPSRRRRFVALVSGGS